MGKRKIEIIAFLLCICLCLCLTPCHTQSASTTEATELIYPDKDCSLTVSYISEENKFSDMPVRMYKVAEVSADYQYTLTASFADTGLIINGIKSVGEWNVIRSTLETHIIVNPTEPDIKIMTDQNGQACFTDLKPGLYLTTTEKVISDDYIYSFDSALVALPGLENDGTWQYEVSVNAKSAVMPPIEPDEETELKVVKLWKGDNSQKERPKEIEVEIFRDGTSYKKVMLSEENHWSYSWSVKNDGADWKVIERNIPSVYTMTVEKRGTTFILMNTLNPEYPDTPRPPHTGDTANIMLYIILMTVSGVVFVAIGFIGKRKHS